MNAKPERTIKLTAQLLDENGVAVAISDGFPTPQLPPHLWRPGDQLHGVHWLALPDDLAPGRYRLVTALYFEDDLARLPATDARGQPLTDAAFTIGDVIIE